MTRREKFFAWLAGGNIKILESKKCDGVRDAYVGRGLLVAALALLSVVFMYGAVEKVLDAAAAATIAALWGVVFVSLERLVLMGLRKRRGQHGAVRLVVAATRLLLAGGMGFILARSAQLTILRGPIERRIAVTNLAERRQARAKADSLYAADARRVEGDRDRLLREMAAKDSTVAEAYRIAELEGAGKRSPHWGNGPLYNADTAHAHMLEREATLLRQRNQRAIIDLDRRRDSLSTLRDEATAETRHAQTGDMADRLEALYDLERSVPAITAVSGMLTIFFITLDVLVTVLKITDTERDEHEAELDRMREEHVAEADAAAQIAVYAAQQTVERRKSEIDHLNRVAEAAFDWAATEALTAHDVATGRVVADLLNNTVRADTTAFGDADRFRRDADVEVPLAAVRE